MEKPMEHLKQFHDLFSGILTPNEVVVYFELFMLGNKRYWPDWIEIADWQLASSANISTRSISTIINSLSQRGLLICERGKGRKISAYKIAELPKYTKNDIITRRKLVDNSGITRRLGENLPCESKDGETSKTQHNTTQHNNGGDERARARVFQLYSDNIHPVSGQIEADRLHSLIDDFGAVWVEHAIEEAAISHAANLRYVEATLNRWKGTGSSAPWDEKKRGQEKAQSETGRGKATEEEQAAYDAMISQIRERSRAQAEADGKALRARAGVDGV